MNEIFKAILIQIGSYVAVLFIGFFLINFLSGGFLLQFLRVKMSRGRMTLVKVVGVSRSYFKPGFISENWLVFTDSTKQKRRLSVPGKEAIEYAMGVRVIAVDDEKNSVILPDGVEKSGYDAVKFQNLYVRALTSPHEVDKMLKFILIFVVLTLVVSIIVGILVFKMSGRLDALSTVTTGSGITEVV